MQQRTQGDNSATLTYGTNFDIQDSIVTIEYKTSQICTLYHTWSSGIESSRQWWSSFSSCSPLFTHFKILSNDYIKQNGDIKTHGLGRYVASFLISTRPVIPGLITGYYNHINKYCNKFVITVYIKTGIEQSANHKSTEKRKTLLNMIIGITNSLIRQWTDLVYDISVCFKTLSKSCSHLQRTRNSATSRQFPVPNTGQ